MSRKSIIVVAMLGALVLATVTLPRIDFYMLTGRFTPITKIETLQHPVVVTQWNSEGLRLSDGRMVQLPGLRSLPSQSAVLAEVTKRGVEVGVDGRVWGVVRIHHWCGNDPVREHIARVELANMMMFLRVGESINPVPEAAFLAREPGGRFSEWGWNISEFSEFQLWQSIKDSAR